MDAYALHLFGMAVESSRHVDVRATVGTEWRVIAKSADRGYRMHEGPTLADALAALLRDLGVEVPERPTAERRAEVIRFMDRAYETAGSTGVTNYLLADRERVLALLEGGGG